MHISTSLFFPMFSLLCLCELMHFMHFIYEEIIHWDFPPLILSCFVCVFCCQLISKLVC